MAPFHLKNRRYVLLTYSQAGPEFDYWAVVDMLSSHGAECIIGRESHADGGTHFHVFVDFGRLFSTRKTNVFDVGGHHPNILPVWKSPGEAFDYAAKDGDIVAGGLERPGTDCDYDIENFWACAGASQSGEEFLHFLDQLAPRDLMRGFIQFRSYADWKWAVAPERYVDPPGVVFDTGHVEQLSEWLSQADLGSGPRRVRLVAHLHGSSLAFRKPLLRKLRGARRRYFRDGSDARRSAYANCESFVGENHLCCGDRASLEKQPGQDP